MGNKNTANIFIYFSQFPTCIRPGGQCLVFKTSDGGSPSLFPSSSPYTSTMNT